MTELTTIEPEYTAVVEVNKMTCYYNNDVDTVLTLRANDDAQEILIDWARLDISCNDVQRFQDLALANNVRIDDIEYSDDGDHIICNHQVLAEV